MKKQIAFVLIFIFVSGFFGCQSQKKPDIRIEDGVESVSVTCFHAGREDKWTMEGADLDDLRNWAATLQYTKTQQPEIADGSQEYKFSMTDKAFSYIINGKDEHYLIIGENWFSVLNPTYPPGFFISCVVFSAAAVE